MAWNQPNQSSSGGGGGGGVTNVSATAPLTSSGGATPNIDASYNAANGIAKLDASAFLAFSQVNGALSGASAALNINAQKITNAGTPTVASDLTTKSYVDALVQGLLTKAPVRLATTAALAANTYNNGVLGVGATLTANANGALTIDGVAVAATDRILVKNEAASANDGIYTVTATGSAILPYILTRALDMNTASEFPGSYVLSLQGTANTNRGWTLVLDPDTAFVVGTTAQTWLQFTGVGDITAGNGISITGNSIAVSTTLPDNYTMGAAGTALSITNNATVSGVLTLGSVSGASGTGALSLGSWTGDNTLATGAVSWTGASAKTVSIASTAAAITLSTTTSGAINIDAASGVNLKKSAATLIDVGATSATAVTLAANINLSGAAGTGALSLGSMTGDTTLATGALNWTGASGKAVALAATAAAITLSTTTSGAINVDGAGGINLKKGGTTNLDVGVTTNNTLTLGAGISLAAAAGATALSFGSATGDTALPTGALSWAGASGKAGSIVSTGAAITLTADAASTWKTSTGALNIDAATSINLGPTTATGVAIGRSGQTVTLTGRVTFSQGLVGSQAITDSQSGTVNNYAPASASAGFFFKITPGAATVFTGFSFGQVGGRILIIHNSDTTNNITLNNEDAGSTAANRFTLPASTLVIAPGKSQWLWYDTTSSRWFLAS